MTCSNLSQNMTSGPRLYWQNASASTPKCNLLLQVGGWALHCSWRPMHSTLPYEP